MVPCYAPAAFVPVRGEGSRVWDQDGPDVHRLRQRRRGHRARPLPPGDGARARRSRRRKLWHVSNWFTNEPALRLAQRLIDAHLRRARVLLQLGRRGERGGAQARAPLRARPLRRAEDSASSRRSTRSTAARCSRSRPAGRRSTRPASAPIPSRHHAHAVQRRRRARSRVRGARRRDLRGDPRADAGRRRHDARHARVPAGRAAAVRRARRAADPRRDPERHGPHRRALLVHAEGHRAGHPDERQGPGRRLSRSARC